ncbi:MAG TPA: S8 family serine peptidase [Cyclobacteriaceae bacterium]|nr:S8 family serine peptidase [Cyclobacteriaceae bacterium]
MSKSIGLMVMILMFGSSIGFAQDRYAIHYRYKPQTDYHLDVPEELMLAKAVNRRLREGVSLDSTDLPVSPKYIEELKPLVSKIQYHSKWLNASVVVATAEQIAFLEALPFVDRAELVAKGFYDASHGGKMESGRIPVSISLKSKKDNSYDLQNEILGIPAMHDMGFTGEGITIAVFDAGFNNADKISGMQHLFDKNRIIAMRDFVGPEERDVFHTDGHGTAALSVMAAYQPRQLVAGAYDAQYVLCITEDVRSEYRIEEYNWVRAAEFADSLGVDIINSSLGYNRFDDARMNYAKEDLDGKTAIITQGAVLAARKGILVVSSAGNEGNGSWQTLTAPADGDGVLAVGAVNNQLQKSSFSSTGPTADGRIKPDLVALGSNVTIWRQVDSPNISSGTSFSSPQIAALAAGLWQAKPEWTRAQLMERLLKSGSQANDPDTELGYGVPNFTSAYFWDDLEPGEVAKSYLFPNPLDGDELFIHHGKDTDCMVRIIHPQGQVIADGNLHRSTANLPYKVRMKNIKPGLYIVECRDKWLRKNYRLLIE